MPAVTATGLEKLTCCQPEAVSPVKVAEASCWPPADQRAPTCVPVFVAPLEKRTPLTKPLLSAVNATPSTTDPLSPESMVAGVAEPKIVQGQTAAPRGVTALEVEAGPVPTALPAATWKV